MTYLLNISLTCIAEYLSKGTLVDKSARFWNRLANRYASQAISDQDAYEKKLEVTRQYFTVNSEVLELGCGTGSTAVLHSPYVKRIHAVDFSSGMLEIARTNAKKEEIRNITFECVSVENFVAKENSYDVVLGLNVLHLLEDKEQAIRRVYKILKPGGVFVTSTICIAESKSLIKYVIPIARFFGFMPMLTSFSGEQLESSMLEAGFDIDYLWQKRKGKAVFLVSMKQL